MNTDNIAELVKAEVAHQLYKLNEPKGYTPEPAQTTYSTWNDGPTDVGGLSQSPVYQKLSQLHEQIHYLNDLISNLSDKLIPVLPNRVEPVKDNDVKVANGIPLCANIEVMIDHTNKAVGNVQYLIKNVAV